MDNIFLGHLRVSVPPAAAAEQSIDVRFTYDTSGLLEIDTRVTATGATGHLVIENQPGVLSSEEIETRLVALSQLKIHPRDQAENQAVLARAERLYAERLGDERALTAAGSTASAKRWSGRTQGKSRPAETSWRLGSTPPT